EVATGGLVARLPEGHRGRITVLAFSPDGKVLASGSTDTTVLLWDWEQVAGLMPEQPPPRTAHQLEESWVALAEPDASNAYRAMGRFTALEGMTVTFVRDRLPPATDTEKLALQRLVTGLDDERFAVRERASRELARLGAEAVPFLREARGKVSTEAK